MGKSVYSKEQIQKCIDLYKSGMLVEKISKETGIEKSSISYIAKREGLQLRRKRNSTLLVCHNCKSKVEIKGAKFCPFCGNDVRNENEVLIDELRHCLCLIQNLPCGDEDTARKTIFKVIDKLKEG